MTTDEILIMGQFSLMHLPSVPGMTKEVYPEWMATSWTPRRERAEGNTPREALDALIEKLGMK